MHSLVFFILASCSLSSTSFVEANKNQSGFTIDLIHRDSPLSPFYNSSKTLLDHIRNTASHSDAQASANENESTIISNNGVYLTRFYIGTPPMERFGIVLTGSDLTWVQCLPCFQCHFQESPIYDRSKSSTFTNISCDSQNCTLLPPRQQYCGTSKECLYSYHYGERFTVGHLGIDSINFGANITFPKFIFGCGYYNIMHFKTGKVMGVVGLGPGPLSLVSQLGHEIGHKFSYCLIPFNSTTNSKLKFGNEAMILGNGVLYSTPLIIKSPFYFLNLEGITIGEKKVQVGQNIDDGNIIIDSGTTLMRLQPSCYNDFVTSLKEVIGVEAVEEEHVPYPFKFCFTHDQHGMSFPDVVFQFMGADIPLSPKNLFFIFDNNMHCLAIIPTDSDGIPIFGNVAQIDFQVVYDLEEGKVSFAPTNCTNNYPRG